MDPRCSDTDRAHVAFLSSLILRPLDNSREDETALVHEWLRPRSVHQWLDFGAGLQDISYQQLSFILKNPSNLCRLYCDKESSRPVGVIVLSNIRNKFKVASLWGVRGEPKLGLPNMSEVATQATLFLAFSQLGINAVTAWVVEGNVRSIALLQRIGFRQSGVQSACHYLGERLTGRVHFEILADEFLRRHIGGTMPCEINQESALMD